MANRVAELRNETYRGKVYTADEDQRVTDVQGRRVPKEAVDVELEKIRQDMAKLERNYRKHHEWQREKSSLANRTQRETQRVNQVQTFVNRRVGEREERAKLERERQAEDVRLTPDGTAV